MMEARLLSSRDEDLGLRGEAYAKALLNIIEDIGQEKIWLQDAQVAILNILEDLSEEKMRLETTQKAVFNIQEDLIDEKVRLESTQRAVLNILDDLSSSEQAIRASLEEKDMLLKEVHHRVKNNLQIVSSLLSLQSRHFDDPKIKEIFRECQLRLRTMSLIHQRLYQTQDFSRINIPDYINDLMNDLFRSYNIFDNVITRRIEVEDIRLGIDIAIPIGLIVNEIVTNSLKHAFPKGRHGEIFLRFRPAEDSSHLLIIGDNGIGLPEGFEFETAKTLGISIVTALCQQLRGQIKISGRDGTIFTLKLSL